MCRSDEPTGLVLIDSSAVAVSGMAVVAPEVAAVVVAEVLGSADIVAAAGEAVPAAVAPATTQVTYNLVHDNTQIVCSEHRVCCQGSRQERLCNWQTKTHLLLSCERCSGCDGKQNGRCNASDASKDEYRLLVPDNRQSQFDAVYGAAHTRCDGGRFHASQS